MSNKSILLLALLTIAVLTCAMSLVFFLDGDRDMAGGAGAAGIFVFIFVLFMLPMILDTEHR